MKSADNFNAISQQPIATDRVVCLCLLVTFVNPPKMDEWIEMPFG